MAATEILTKDGTAITWEGAGGDYGISLESMAAAGAAQGAKGDLGATRADWYDVEFVMETGTAPGSGEVYDLYWAASLHATAATDNPGGCSGADAAYTGAAGDSIADSVKQLQFVGSLVVTSDANTIQRQFLRFTPLGRYGMPVVVNNTAQTSESNHDEMYIKLTPRIPESQ